MNGLHQVHLVFGVYPSTTGDIEQRYVGKFWRTSRRVAVLEDRQGLLDDLPEDAVLSPAVVRHLDSLAMSAYLRVVPMQPSRRGRGETMSENDDDLTLAQTVAKLRSLVDSGQLPAEALAALEHALFRDELVPSLGNLRSYRDHLGAAGSAGVYVELDFDFPRAASDPRAHREAREEAELAAGALVRRAVDEVLGKEHRDAWHTSGPRFAVFTTSDELGHAISASLDAHLDRSPSLAAGKLGLKHRVVDAAVARARGAIRG